MKVLRPPKNFKADVDWDSLEKREEFFKVFNELVNGAKYLSYNDIHYRSKGFLPELLWLKIKEKRKHLLQPLFTLGENKNKATFVLSTAIQKIISSIDKETTNSALEKMTREIGEEKYFKYLINDLLEDEAISSSQLEGAATTTIVAKDMLKSRRKPKNNDEKMILGNLQMMSYVWKNRNKKLTLEMIKKVHRIGVGGVDDEKYFPGEFRDTNNVVVSDFEGNVVHTPPCFSGIDNRLNEFIDWINCDHTKNLNYIHPLIKAMSLHFMIGYEHPFRDGNGRVARSLFYWYMFKCEYPSFRYMAISSLLKNAPKKYVCSYLNTEYDEFDLTYFFEYQCKIISEALCNFKELYEKTRDEINKFNSWFFESGLYTKLSMHQKTILQVAKRGISSIFTIRDVEKNLGCSYNTAASVLNGLVDFGLFQKEKHGRTWIYHMLDMDLIINSHNTSWETNPILKSN